MLTDHRGLTPLHCAAEKGDLDIVRHMAAHWGRDVVHFLVESGTNHCATTRGRTALDAASERGNTYLSEFEAESPRRKVRRVSSPDRQSKQPTSGTTDEIGDSVISSFQHVLFWQLGLPLWQAFNTFASNTFAQWQNQWCYEEIHAASGSSGLDVVRWWR
ncbi:unnamed protein product [Cladocopium goreaui]|uniref:Uncharacterized protein n=1 Tax=Cladocopium goreaui TaxID=2562237 RepID=A0A9P1D3M3_9DINO|nr:unnamed protein product [Cladocopium goreaui]